MVKEIEMKKFILATVILLMASSLAFGATVVEDETKDTRAKPVSLYVKTGTDVAPIGYDTTVSAVVAIDVLHREIHEGNAFTANTTQLALADDASISIVLTASTKELHCFISGAAEGDAGIFVYKDAVLATAGTELTPSGLNWSIDTTTLTTRTSATCVTTPTMSSYGTQKDSWLIIGGSGNKTSGGAHSGRYEYVVPEGSNIHVRLENEGGAAKDCALHIDYYEE